MEFNLLPKEIKRMIFDVNRETAKKEKEIKMQKIRYEMVKVEFKMNILECNGEVDVCDLFDWDTEDCADGVLTKIIQGWYSFANRDNLCFYDLVDYLGSKDFDVFHILWLTIYSDNPDWERFDIRDDDEKKWWLRQMFRERCEDTLSVIKENGDIMDITQYGLPQK